MSRKVAVTLGIITLFFFALGMYFYISPEKDLGLSILFVFTAFVFSCGFSINQYRDNRKKNKLEPTAGILQN